MGKKSIYSSFLCLSCFFSPIFSFPMSYMAVRSMQKMSCPTTAYDFIAAKITQG